MKPLRLLASLLLAVASICLGQEPSPVLRGYVTRVASPTDFDVNGMHIVLGPKATVQKISRDKSGTESSHTTARGLNPYLGELIEVYGKMGPKKRSIDADRLMSRVTELRDVMGSGVIDSLLPLPQHGAAPDDLLIRADGYPILVSATMKCTFKAPLRSRSDIHANVWVAFHGKQRSDGVVIPDLITFVENSLSSREEEFRQETEYDPTAIDPKVKQDPTSKELWGINPRFIPPYNDPVLQARVSAIGAKLVPKYQSELPASEQTRINFRFQLIDSPQWPLIWTLPSGIVLVPRQTAQLMQNDSQLAAILADSIACAIEEQPLDTEISHTAKEAGKTAAIAGAALAIAPVGTMAVWGGMKIAQAGQEKEREQQSGRVSLDLLHDAGYDIEQAPLAWWILLSKKPQDFADTPVPARALYLYRILGETWHTE